MVGVDLHNKRPLSHDIGIFKKGDFRGGEDMKCSHYYVSAVSDKDKSCTHLWRCGPICNDGDQVEGTKTCFDWIEFYKAEGVKKELHNKLAELNAKRPDCTLCENGGLHGCSESYCVWFAPKLESKYKEVKK